MLLWLRLDKVFLSAVVLMILLSGMALAGELIVTEDGVKIWNPAPATAPNATWSGSRDAENFATGTGTLQVFLDNSKVYTYEGQVIKGKPHGSGLLTSTVGDSYEGSFVEGRKSGRGLQKYANGSSYEGDYADNKFQGKGIFKFNNGDIYEGNWDKGLRNGRGVMKYANGNIYEGEFFQGFY